MKEFNVILATIVLIIVAIGGTILISHFMGEFTFEMVIAGIAMGIVIGIIFGTVFPIEPKESNPEWIEYEEQIFTEDFEL